MTLRATTMALARATALRHCSAASPATAAAMPFFKSSSSSMRPFTSSTPKLGGGGEHHHSEDMYDPPGGWLWGQNPREKYEEEGWEKLWYWGFFGGLGVAAIAYQFKPDTTCVDLPFLVGRCCL
ncbi:hypothetical protein BKA80DRAFT_276628 [Phyllosticta citrichinensis]